MDISALYTKNSATLTITHPITNKATDITIGVMSPDSFDYKRILIEQAKILKSNDIDINEYLLNDDNMIDFLSKVTLNWDNVEFEGAKLECTKDNIKMVYKSSAIIREQVNNFIGNKVNFLANA